MAEFCHLSCAIWQSKNSISAQIMFFRFVNWLRTKKEERDFANSYRWFEITLDETHVFVNVAQPGQPQWNDKFRWDQITRVCFEATDYMVSDNIHVFVKQSSETHTIPMEASGGRDLWKQILDRELFDPGLAIEAFGSAQGMFCWPMETDQK